MQIITYKHPEVAANIIKYLREKGVPVGTKNIAKHTNYSVRKVNAFCLEGESKSVLRRVIPSEVGSNKYVPSLPIVVKRKDRVHGGMVNDINVLTGGVRSKALNRFRRQQLNVFTLA